MVRREGTHLLELELLILVPMRSTGRKGSSQWRKLRRARGQHDGAKHVRRLLQPPHVLYDLARVEPAEDIRCIDSGQHAEGCEDIARDTDAARSELAYTAMRTGAQNGR